MVSMRVMKIPSSPSLNLVNLFDEKYELTTYLRRDPTHCLTAGMSACKNEEAPVTTPTTAEAATSGEKISFDVDIAGLPSR